MSNLASDFNKCPACDSADYCSPDTDTTSLRQCTSCSAIYGICTREQAMAIVNLNEWDVAFAGKGFDPKFFAFMVEPEHAYMHGWYDTKTKKVLQFG
jgi:hypothetical protein